MPANQPDTPILVATIGGIQIRPFGVTIESGSYGSMSGATIHVAIQNLQQVGINLTGLNASQGGLDVTIGVQGETAFGGLYLHGRYVFHEDYAEIDCRDYAGRLADTTSSLAELNYTNQTVSQMVQQIAQKGGLTAKVTIKNDPNVGVILEDQSTLASHPQPLWNLLNALAKLSGANISTTADQQLIFDDSGTANAKDNSFLWLGNQFDADNPPIKALEYLHQPARNKNFAVIVMSHHQKTTTTSIATVTVAGEDIQVTNKATVKAGVYTGAAGARTRSLFSVKGVPSYIFRPDGQTKIQVQNEAEAKAAEIAKKLLLCWCTVMGDNSIKPQQKLTIKEQVPGSLLGFPSIDLFITAVSHYYDVPQSDAVTNSGYLTRITALTVPPSIGATTLDEIGGMGG